MPMGSSQTFNNTRVEYVEDKEVCPYNKSHLIRPERMQQHLIKCRKDVLSKPTHPFHHEAKHMTTCPLNANHHVVKAELSRHLQNCSSRLELRKAEVDDGPAPEWRSAIPQGRTVETTEDDWGEEADANPHEAYDPERKVMDSASPYLYNIQGKSKSEKRNYRAEQRLKYATNQGGGGRDHEGDLPVGLNYKNDTNQQNGGGWGSGASNGGWGSGATNGWNHDSQEKHNTVPGLHVKKKTQKQGNGGGQNKAKGSGGQDGSSGTKGWDDNWEEKTSGKLKAINLPSDTVPYDAEEFPSLGGPKK